VLCRSRCYVGLSLTGRSGCWRGSAAAESRPASSRLLSHTGTCDADKSRPCPAVIRRCDQTATFKVTAIPGHGADTYRAPGSVIPCGRCHQRRPGALAVQARTRRRPAVAARRADRTRRDGRLGPAARMREETGLSVRAGRLAGTVRRPAPDGDVLDIRGLRGHGHRRNAQRGRRPGRGAPGGTRLTGFAAEHGAPGGSTRQLRSSQPRRS
jgi:hypothetical protein